nr:lipopolysaccharide core heptose(II) kinase RfaY [uncultured Enterobacter sp.]
MIHKKNIRNLTVFIKDNDVFYENVLLDFLNYNIKILKVFRSIEDTKVILIETERGPMVLKIFSPHNKRAERFLKSFFKRDYYENLIIQTDRLWSEGVKSVNDYYLLAEAKRLNYSRLFIMLIEYIEGTELEEIQTISEEIKAQIKQSIAELHEHDMVSGDPHKGNFILSHNAIRLIDLSGKKANLVRKAKDRLDIERHFKITNEIKDIGFYRLVIKTKIRHFIKKAKESILPHGKLHH